MENNPVPEKKDAMNPYMIPGSIVVAGVLIAAAVIYSTHSTSRGIHGFAGGNQAEIVGAGNLEDDDPFLGNPNAKVTVVEFSDFQCPFCGRFFHETEPKIIDAYVKTGKVKFVYRDFAFLGPESGWAAEAAQCANDQEKFWEYHDYLFNHQKGENQGAFTKERLKEFARALGLKSGSFDLCVDSGKYRAEVLKDTEAGRSKGVSGTPTNFVNGRPLTGALPYDQFQTAIEEALRAAGQ